MTQTVKLGNIQFGNKSPFVLIAGPCVIESRQMAMDHAQALKEITDKVDVPFIFKASYDKANRTSIESFRGPGIEEGLDILKEIKVDVGVPILSDVHSVEEIKQAAEVLDILQIPAFLCRQTDLLIAAGKTGKIVNIKKGQFLSPENMGQVVKKVEHTGNKEILLTERGTSFGYNTLVSDFRSIPTMQKTGYPVIFDATHSVQKPGGLGNVSGGDSQYVPLLARCALAAGCDALFMEVHRDPSQALSDGPNMLALDDMEELLDFLKKIDEVIKANVT